MDLLSLFEVIDFAVILAGMIVVNPGVLMRPGHDVFEPLLPLLDLTEIEKSSREDWDLRAFREVPVSFITT